MPEERPTFSFRKTQRTRARFIVYEQEVIHFAQGARCLALALRAPPFHTAHQRPPPLIRCGIADSTEHRRISDGVERAGAKRERWFESKALRIFPPAGAVFKGRAFLALARTGPQAAGKMTGTVQ